ncbi:MAG TPA: hypothetical protein PK325_07195 [Cyclobacteriaceae bacterium]|nr:hypothetical protein [Cyclobacteriaceae bacterium]HMV09401.1 hypothetical protein [Cyclobacteriaceae bacterium]HMX02422.1 hypothetical protein [Cyclobacteriaceae bacterium]HMX51090.1 hypothetical protein [Cyclobacteriaceae bacterium]HMY91752.1 hypothetical protein [Cyclobacteriaceae bacterium]
MKYLKLFLPIPIVFILMFLAEQYATDLIPIDELVAVEKHLLKAVFFLYYLRLGNNRTPLINTLTVLALGMIAGEYLLSYNSTIGLIAFIVSDILFGIAFFIRQKLKDHFNTMSKLKITAVSLFVLANIIAVVQHGTTVLVGMGVFIMVAVYFYDRLVTIADSKSKA